MGVRFDNEEQRFMFDFEHDGAEDIVSLTGDGYQVEAAGRATSTSVRAHVLPFFRAQAQLKNLTFVLGDIYGGANHRVAALRA